MISIPLGLNVILIIVFSFAGILECRRLLSKNRDLKLETALKSAPYLYALLPFSVILFIGIIILTIIQVKKPSLFWRVPLWLQYYYTPLTWGSLIAIFTFIFTLGSAISFHEKHHERWKVVIAGILLIGVIQLAQWNYTRPVAPDLKNHILSTGFVMQTSDVSRAAASAANIVRLFGMEKTEREMAEILGTTWAGTTAAQIIHRMQRNGFDCRMVEIPDCDPEKVTPPAMFFVGHPMAGPESHVVAYMGFCEDKAEIWDPLQGKIYMNKKDLSRIWEGRGIEVRLDVKRQKQVGNKDLNTSS
ncbi:MAG: cysteine peptidase family C39 domain-containing protein [bacterium]